MGNEIVEITSDIEIRRVDTRFPAASQLLENTCKPRFPFVRSKKPDYRNSIKESISAVEAICRLISNDPKATLGPAVKQVSAKAPFHPAFEKGLAALYGFTSDEDGIRHSLLEESHLDHSDAQFMLVLASGFCSFLLGKCAEKWN